MQNIISDDSIILKKQFLHICDNNLIAALLLAIIEKHNDNEEVCAQMEDREKRARLYTGNTLAQHIYNIGSPDNVIEAMHFLAKKGFINMWWVNAGDKTPTSNRLFYAIYNDAYITTYSKPYLEEQMRLKMARWSDNEQEPSKSTPTRKPRKSQPENQYKTEASRVALQISRAEKLGLPATLTLEQWITTLNHFQWKCAYCQGPYTLIEHFIPLAHGKGTTADNCVPACHKCNSQKGTYHPSQITSMKDTLQAVQQYLTACGREDL
jgi:5-methylcytosine-specific restriction endonuclease McrA